MSLQLCLALALLSLSAASNRSYSHKSIVQDLQNQIENQLQFASASQQEDVQSVGSYLPCSTADECHACILAQIQFNPLCGFDQYWCGCQYIEAVAQKQNGPTYSDQEAANILENAQKRLLSVSANPACLSSGDMFCGCYQAPAGTMIDEEANEQYFSNTLHEFNQNGAASHQSFDAMPCCSVSDCYTCFHQRVAEDMWCGLEDAWCHCQLTDCSDPPHDH